MGRAEGRGRAKAHGLCGLKEHGREREIPERRRRKTLWVSWRETHGWIGRDAGEQPR